MKNFSWKKTLVELLIVFVGVYGAFLLNSYRESIKEDEIQKKYYETFLLSLQRSNNGIKNLKKMVDNTATQAKNFSGSDIPYNRNLDFTNTFFVFESAFAGENFTSIRSDFLINIEQGSSLIKEIEKRFNILNAELRKYQIYHSDSDSPDRQNF